MIAILFTSFFIYLWYRYKSKHGVCVGTWLLLWYAIASVFTLLEYYINPINNDFLDGGATLYYVACQFIALSPFLLLGKLDCQSFNYNNQLFKYLAYVLILFGSIKLVESVIELVTNFSVFINNIAQIRYDFYDTFLIRKDISSFDKLSIIINKMQFMAPFLAFYFLCRGDKRLAVILFITSISSPLSQIVHGEREGALKYIINLVAYFLFFKSALSDAYSKKIKKTIVILTSPFILFIVAMTIGRFGFMGNDMGVLNSLFLYGGDQPFYFSHIFYDANILDQLQYGRVNFQYFFPAVERVQGQINNKIQSDFYLNQFGGLPGSIFLDFGYYTILIIAAFSLAYYMLISHNTNKERRYPVHILFLFVFSFQVLYMNIFYFDFPDLFSILFVVVFFFMCRYYPGGTDTFNPVYNN